MSTITHITAGRASRLAVSALLAFAYQDSGFEDVLNSGNLDATESAPAGSHTYNPEFDLPHRNVVAPQLVQREFGLSYLVTVKDEKGHRRTYTGIGDPGALMDAAYDEGAKGVFIRVRQ